MSGSQSRATHSAAGPRADPPPSRPLPAPPSPPPSPCPLLMDDTDMDQDRDPDVPAMGAGSPVFQLLDADPDGAEAEADVDADGADMAQDGPGLDEDCLQTVLSLLPFREKVKCELVCRSWRRVAERLVRAQKVLGNAPTRMDLVDHCSNPRHWVTALDTLPKQMLTNLTLLPKILLKCPDLRAIAITRSREPTFTEAANAKRRADTSDREDESREMPVDDDDNEPFLFDNAPAAFHRMSVALHLPHGLQPDSHMNSMRRRFMFCQRQQVAQRRAAAPRPSNEEDFLDIVAKYVPKLECIDVSGLKLCRGYRAGSDDAGAWKQITAQCGATLQHVKTFYMRDKELRALLTRCVRLTDVSIIYGLKGDHLSAVSPDFSRMSIGSVKEFGLQQLIQAPDLRNFRHISLSNTNRSMIGILAESLRQITTLNLSLTMYNLTPSDLSRIAYLSHLKHLYVKRRNSSGPFEDFDQPFCEILRRCPDLETIRLTNMVVTDDSMKQIPDAQKLKELSVLFTATAKGEKTLTDRSLCRIATLPFLRKCRIDYPNTFTENTLIDFLFKAFSLRDLLLHGCRELIPIKEILQAAIRQAISMQRQQLSLTIDIDTREKILIESVRNFCKHLPKNLFYTISTGEDFYSTHHHYERPAKDPLADEDFDEHESFLYELQHV